MSICGLLRRLFVPDSRLQASVDDLLRYTRIVFLVFCNYLRVGFKPQLNAPLYYDITCPINFELVIYITDFEQVY